MRSEGAARVCSDCKEEIPEDLWLSPGWKLCGKCFQMEVTAGEVYEDLREDDEDEREEEEDEPA